VSYPTNPSARKRLREKRARAARRYKPARVKTLLVGEAPPNSPDRYFYFEDVGEHDSLFRYVAKGVLGVGSSRAQKGEQLAKLRGGGLFLIDLMLDPKTAEDHDDHVPGLIRRVKRLRPKKVILIKAPVFDAAYGPLLEAGLPVVGERVPFPGSGQQRRFEEAFARALRQSFGQGR
jgi:hypothetical protein